jgi:hypothetical protein
VGVDHRRADIGVPEQFLDCSDVLSRFQFVRRKGTRWLQAGGDIYKLSKILGYSSVGVTKGYEHVAKLT